MWWHILGTESTADEMTVKKAYANVIRGVNQDDEIEMFTKIHLAYREAMKSFRKVKKSQSTILSAQGHSLWYLNELDKVYNSSLKRLNPSAWENLFACMSFSEEKHFVDKYVNYFNHHYYLTDRIWKIIEKNYPLSTHNDFERRELCNGHFHITEDELKGMSRHEQFQYVEQKITLYYLILDHNHERAMDYLALLTVTNPCEDFTRWLSVLTSIQTRQKQELRRPNFLNLGVVPDKVRKLLSKGHYDKGHKLWLSLMEKQSKGGSVYD